MNLIPLEQWKAQPENNGLEPGEVYEGYVIDRTPLDELFEW